MTLDLDCPNLVVGNKEPVPDVCVGALGSQSFVLWTVNCRDGTFAVDVQSERIQCDVPGHGRCIIFAISSGLPWQNVARYRPIRCRLEATTAQPARRSAPLPDEEPSVKMCPSKSPSGGRLCQKTWQARSGKPVGRMAPGSGKMPRANCSLYCEPTERAARRHLL